MPGCAIVGCINSSSKKVRMCRIPANQNTRALWLEQINRKNWEPTANSMICQYHFTDDMWEKPREDGKMKLKFNAVPTIFGDGVKQIPYSPKQKKRRPKDQCTSQNITEKSNQIEQRLPETEAEMSDQLNQCTSQIEAQQSILQDHIYCIGSDTERTQKVIVQDAFSSIIIDLRDCAYTQDQREMNE